MHLSLLTQLFINSQHSLHFAVFQCTCHFSFKMTMECRTDKVTSGIPTNPKLYILPVSQCARLFPLKKTMKCCSDKVTSGVPTNPTLIILRALQCTYKLFTDT